MFSANIALNQPAYQISDYTGYSAPADLAVDGITETQMHSSPTCVNCCTHTEHEYQTVWWLVDLGAQYFVDSVIVYNRGDCCGKTWSQGTQEQNKMSSQNQFKTT